MQRLHRFLNVSRIKAIRFSSLLFFFCVNTQTLFAAPTDDFVTTWKTDNYGVSNSTSIEVPMVGGPYEADWNNDGEFEAGLYGTTTHNYGAAGTYTVRIRGVFSSIRFAWEGDTEKILSLDQWGTNSWTSMNNAFAGAWNMTVPATDTPDFSAVTDMASMFESAELANPDTSGWDTSSVTDMSWMFASAISANPDTSGWTTSFVTSMQGMFWDATAFDRDIGSWDVTSLTDATDMFYGVTLSTSNYESLLTGWDAQVLQSGVTFSGGNSVYCAAPAVAARANMIASDSWVITDGGQCPPSAPIMAPDMTPETDTGPFDDDDITTDSTPAFYVQCSIPGNIITLYTDNPVANTAIGERVCKTSSIETATSTTALDVGAHNITYTDRAGDAESGHSPALSITVDPPAPSDDFVTTWQTDNPGTSNSTSITVPMVGGPYNIDWNNDGNFDEVGVNGSVTHDFQQVGTYTIRIWGAFDSIQFANGGDKEKIISLDQWGTNTWTSMYEAFFGTVNLNVPAIDIPDFSNMSSMYRMFYGATLANPDTSGWNTSSITDMALMFTEATSADPDTSGWDTSSVTDMGYMFLSATSANPNTNGWDTSAVTSMKWMFYQASSANPDTSGWNTSNVTDMRQMFAGATSANPDTSGWDTSSVTNMSNMFQNAVSANPDTSGWDTSAVIDMSRMFYGDTSANPVVSGWNTSAVTNMSYMFYGAGSFDQDIHAWNITSLTNATAMFSGVTLSTSNYESLLTGWNAQALKPGVTFSGGNSTYCSAAAATARANMIASDSWVITDGGKSCSPGYACNVNVISATTEYFDALHEACEVLVLGPDFIAADGANVAVSSGWEIDFMPGFTVEQGATLDAAVCGQSLCLTSPDPMPYGCHTCVDQICDTEPSCCGTAFDQSCVDKVASVCGLVCE